LAGCRSCMRVMCSDGRSPSTDLGSGAEGGIRSGDCKAVTCPPSRNP
jgi:hypothetical protein